MPHSLSKAHNHKESHKQKSAQSHKHLSEHGHAKRSNSDPLRGGFKLLELPAESLTHVTSFLDPSSLLSLSGANKRLHEHIEDDNTWRRAYVYQFLGVPPEGDIYESCSPDGLPGKAFMLRREESSWKREFVRRWNLRRRWENIRPTTISHIPVHSNVDEIHLMPSSSPTPAILTASLRYGVVARSYPLTGKILRGYLDASGTLNGLGNGNPNAEFSPDVTRCVLSADGGTARVLWGFRTGAVAVTIANKAMDSARAVGARYTRCSIGEAHEGVVEDAAWASECGNPPNFFVTAGADGRVKIWEAKRVTCVWTSKGKPGQVVKDPCLKVAVDAVTGVVAVALKSGEIAVWAGFAPLFSEVTTSIDDSAIQEIRIAAPPSNAISGPYADAARGSVAFFHLFCQSPSHVSVLSAFKNEPRLYRDTIHLSSGVIERITFGDESTGAITALQPVFPSKPGEYAFILAGDHLGSISVFPWDGVPVLSQAASSASSTSRSVPPSRRIQVHDNSAVVALAWTPTVLVTGSSKGSLRAFDSLTLSSLRSFAYSSLRTNVEEEVKDIVVERDFFAASIGNRVVAWRGESPGKAEKNWKAKRSVTRASNAVAKYHQQVEISREIYESRRELEHEQAHVRRNFGREREQNSTLAHLGLTEVEAVEYILMLSRDEEERRQLAQPQIDEEVLLGEFDEDVRTPPTSRQTFLCPSSHAPADPFAYGNNPPFIPSSSSSSKIQISPRRRPEPMEAGFAAGSPLSRSTSGSGSLSSSFSSSHGLSRTNSQTPSPEDPDQFPSMSSTPTKRSVSGSPQSVRSAWSTPLKSAKSSGPSSPRNGPIASSPAMSRSPGVSLLSAKLAAATVAEEEDEDEELRFVLELSLAEARSRGDDV